MFGRWHTTPFIAGISLALMTIAWSGVAAHTPLKVAFIGDQGNGTDAEAVLTLILNEGADAVFHQGDFDYDDNPSAWDAMITGILGADFPYFASVGNHDDSVFYGPGGYQEKLQQRLDLIPDASCSGGLGVTSSCTYKGLSFILSGIGTMPEVPPDDPDHIAFIQNELVQSGATFRICSWHKNQTDMQVGGKSDAVGWLAYEACREGGAIVATGHEHSYSRTHLMDHFESLSVADTSNTLQIEKGKTFAFVSGLGGKSIRNQDRSGSWWASIYTSDQNANFGALFCTFFVGGDPTRASCYFKDILGNVPDQFEIVSAVLELVADFTASQNTGEVQLLVDFDASSSLALNGTIISYEWDFGDGTTDSGRTVSHVFGQIDTYTVTLTVTDDLGNTATTSQIITTTGPLILPVTLRVFAEATVIPATTVHVGDLDDESFCQNIKCDFWRPNVLVTVHDEIENPVAGATVTGTYATGKTESCRTNMSGICRLDHSGGRSPWVDGTTTSITFRVSSVTDTLTYASSANHDFDADSDGTDITLQLPSP